MPSRERAPPLSEQVPLHPQEMHSTVSVGSSAGSEVTSSGGSEEVSVGVGASGSVAAGSEASGLHAQRRAVALAASRTGFIVMTSLKNCFAEDKRLRGWFKPSLYTYNLSWASCVAAPHRLAAVIEFMPLRYEYYKDFVSNLQAKFGVLRLA